MLCSRSKFGGGLSDAGRSTSNSVIPALTKLRRETKNLSPVAGERAIGVGNVFYLPSSSSSPAGACLLNSLGGRTLLSPG
jgi:hypothetical protein